MEASADAGSVARDVASAGTPDTQQKPAENGSAAGADTPFAGLQDAGTRSWVEKKGYKSVEDLAKAAISQESFIGSAVKVPAADANDAEWDKFYARAGRPEKPDGYAFKRPENLPAELPYDEALAGVAKSMFHKAGLNGKQAQMVHDGFAAYQAELVTKQVAAITKSVEDSAAQIAKEYGPQDSATFKTANEMANRALKKLGLLESFKKSGIVLSDGAVTDPAAFAALVNIGKTMFTEDTIDGDASVGGPNPFKEPKNLTAISQLVANDPDKARRLAREAGVDPAAWVDGKRK